MMLTLEHGHRLLEGETPSLAEELTAGGGCRAPGALIHQNA